MPKTRTIISWLIFIIAVVVMVMPLPSQDDSHLMAESEANDSTLVILTTDRTDTILPLVASFQAKYEADVQVVETDYLTPETIQQAHADLVLAHDVTELMPLVGSLDALAPDLLWNIDPRFGDPAGRWIGFAGRLQVMAYAPEQISAENLADTHISHRYTSDEQTVEAILNGDIVAGWVEHITIEAPLAMVVPTNPRLSISAFALASSANSKPLAQLFLNTLYLPTAQRTLVETTGQYSFSAFSVGTPANLPTLAELSLPNFGQQYNTNHQPDPNRVASIQ